MIQFLMNALPREKELAPDLFVYTGDFTSYDDYIRALQGRCSLIFRTGRAAPSASWETTTTVPIGRTRRWRSVSPHWQRHRAFRFSAMKGWPSGQTYTFWLVRWRSAPLFFLFYSANLDPESGFAQSHRTPKRARAADQGLPRIVKRDLDLASGEPHCDAQLKKLESSSSQRKVRSVQTKHIHQEAI